MFGILGDPGGVSGGGKQSNGRKKFGRRKVKNANCFLAGLDFFPPPLTAPGSPRMRVR